MKKKIVSIVFVCLLLSTTASAHVMNKNNTFADLALSEHANDVVLLASLGIVSYLNDDMTFEPAEPLTAQDLAAWAAKYNGLEGKTVEELAQAALAHNLISTIDGNATYALVNEVYFHNQLQVEQPTAILTRDEFAAFVAENVHTNIGGHSLLQMSGFTEGPTGTVEAVEHVKKQTETGDKYYIYVITVDGKEYELGMHPRAISESADPSVWVGQTIAESYIGTNSSSDDVGKQNDHSAHFEQNDVAQAISATTIGTTAIQLIVIGDQPYTNVKAGQESNQNRLEEETTQMNQMEQTLTTIEDQIKEPSLEDEKQHTGLIILLVIILVFIISGSIFLKKTKKQK
ncbi:hypothetical protein NSQ62_12110 [Solibacillus sp. FSL H8-0523]|uniref:hypothetical protein n=1 Tax=unclassified Solibacillus TaxID=2637870 RepID=UPI0031013776